LNLRPPDPELNKSQNPIISSGANCGKNRTISRLQMHQKLCRECRTSDWRTSSAKSRCHTPRCTSRRSTPRPACFRILARRSGEKPFTAPAGPDQNAKKGVILIVYELWNNGVTIACYRRAKAVTNVPLTLPSISPIVKEFSSVAELRKPSVRTAFRASFNARGIVVRFPSRLSVRQRTNSNHWY